MGNKAIWRRCPMASVSVPRTGESRDCPSTVARAAPPAPARPDRELPPISANSCGSDMGGTLRRSRLPIKRSAGPAASTVTFTNRSWPPPSPRPLVSKTLAELALPAVPGCTASETRVFIAMSTKGTNPREGVNTATLGARGSRRKVVENRLTRPRFRRIRPRSSSDGSNGPLTSS